MDEEEVIEHIIEYFWSNGYSAKFVGNTEPLDIIAKKNGDLWVVEVKGDEKGKHQSVQLCRAVGQIVAHLGIMGDCYHYAIGVTRNLARYLYYWNTEGVELLKLHLFMVAEDGRVEYKDTEGFVELIEYLKKLHSYIGISYFLMEENYLFSKELRERFAKSQEGEK